MLSRRSTEPSQFIPGKPAKLWQAAAAGETRAPDGVPVSANVTLPRECAAKVYEMLIPDALPRRAAEPLKAAGAACAARTTKVPYAVAVDFPIMRGCSK